MNIVTLWRRFYASIFKPIFAKKFDSFDLTSSIGTNSLGKSCTIIGSDRMSIGKNTYIGPGTEVTCLHSHFQQHLDSYLEIGNHVRITKRCRITCAGRMKIEDDVLIAPDVFITDNNHGMNPEIEGGYSPQPLIVKDVCIGEGVWLGQRVCVLPGVKIGKHSIVGANSVVTHDIPAFAIAVGSPAKVVKKWDFEEKKWVKEEA